MHALAFVSFTVLILLAYLNPATNAATIGTRSSSKYTCTWKLWADVNVNNGYCWYEDAPESFSLEDREVPCKNTCYSNEDRKGCTFKIDKKTRKPAGLANCGLPN